MTSRRAEHTRLGMEAFSSGHFSEEVAEQTLAEDAVWHLGGSSPLAGQHRGRDAIRGFLNSLIEKTQGTARVEPMDLLVGDDFTMSFTRFTAERDGEPVEFLFADAWRWDDQDRITEYWTLVNDQAGFDAWMS